MVARGILPVGSWERLQLDWLEENGENRLERLLPARDNRSGH
jgi:hypothetical protein